MYNVVRQLLASGVPPLVTAIYCIGSARAINSLTIKARCWFQGG